MARTDTEKMTEIEAEHLATRIVHELRIMGFLNLENPPDRFESEESEAIEIVAEVLLGQRG